MAKAALLLAIHQASLWKVLRWLQTRHAAVAAGSPVCWPLIIQIAVNMAEGAHKRRPLCRKVRSDTALPQRDPNTVPFILRTWDEDDTLINSSTYANLEPDKGAGKRTVREEDWRCLAESAFKDPSLQPEHNQISVSARRPPSLPPPPSIFGCLGVSRASYSHNPKQIGFRHRGKPHGLDVSSALAPRSSANRQHMAASYGADYGASYVVLRRRWRRRADASYSQARGGCAR